MVCLFLLSNVAVDYQKDDFTEKDDTDTALAHDEKTPKQLIFEVVNRLFYIWIFYTLIKICLRMFFNITI